MARIILLMLIALPLAGFAEGGPQIQDAAPPPQGRAEWLIERMKAIADAGLLFQPDEVARILSLDLKETQPDAMQHSVECSNPYARSWHASSFEPQDQNWYVGTPEGIPHMVRPGFTINRPAVMGDPKFSYSIKRITSCGGRNEPKQYAEARIDFAYESGYACITIPRLNKVLPEAKFAYATDGARPYFYTGKFDDASKTTIQFFFFAGAQCMIGATIEQSEKSGKRLLRAQSKFEQCRRKAEHDFCGSHEPFNWGDGKIIDQLNDATVEKCGTLASYYEAEPQSGIEPMPLPPRGTRMSPCDDTK